MSEVDEGHVQQTFPDDPMEVIRREDVQERNAALETALRDAMGESVPETGEGTSDEPETAPTSVKRAPIDQTLAALRNSNLSPEQQEAIKATIATNTRLQQEAAAIDRNLDSAVQKAVAQALAETQRHDEDDDDSPTSSISPEQRRLFEQIAEDLGFVKQSHLIEKETQNSRMSYLAEGRNKGLEEYGDRFALRDEDGNIVIPPEVQKRMAETFEPIRKNGTINSHDLYTLAYHKELMQAEYERGIEEGKAHGTGRRVERQNARVEMTTNAAPLSVNIRGKRGSKDDDRNAVFARAALLARNALKRS